MRRGFLILIGTIFCFSMILYLIIISRMIGLPWPELLSQFKSTLYVPNANQCIVQEIQGINPILLYDGFLLTGTFVLIVVLNGAQRNKSRCLRISRRPHSKGPTDGWNRSSRCRAVMAFQLLALLAFAGIQQIARLDHFKHEALLFTGKSLYEKNLILSGPKFQFAHDCQQALSSYHQADLITDDDLSRDPSMHNQRVLSYYLYPKVSLRFDNQSPKDAIVLIHKKNPLEHIPEDYEILVSNEDHQYILAVKKRAAP